VLRIRHFSADFLGNASFQGQPREHPAAVGRSRARRPPRDLDSGL